MFVFHTLKELLWAYSSCEQQTNRRFSKTHVRFQEMPSNVQNNRIKSDIFVNSSRPLPEGIALLWTEEKVIFLS